MGGCMKFGKFQIKLFGNLFFFMYEICFYSCLLSYYMLINVDYTLCTFGVGLFKNILKKNSKLFFFNKTN